MRLFILLPILVALCLTTQAQTGVYVGTTAGTPLEMLHVEGAILVGTTNGTNAGSIRWNGTNFQGYDGTQWLDLDQQGGADTDWTLSGNDQYSAVSGNVGIGTTTPDALLELYRAGGTSSMRITKDGTQAGELFFVNGDNGTLGTILSLNSSEHFVLQNNYPDKDVFFNVNDGGVQTDVLFLDGAESRVGILNTAPDYALDISGDLGIDDNLIHNGDDNTFISFTTDRIQLFAGSTASSWIDIQSSDSELAVNENSLIRDFRVEGGGDADLLFVDGSTDRVGISTNLPDATLDLEGTFQFVDGNQGLNKVLRSDATGMATWVDVNTLVSTSQVVDEDNDTKVQVEESTDEDRIRFDTGGTQRMIVDEYGNVGIGTGTPAQKLHLELDNNGLNTALFLRNRNGNQTGGNGVGIGFINEANDVNAVAKAGIFHERSTNYGVGNMHFLLNSDNSSNAAVSLSDARMTILAGGNVGVGTTAPAAKLEVNGQLMVSGSSPAARLLLAGYSATEGGELQLNGGSSHTSSAYAIDNFEGRLRIMKTTNTGGTGSTSTEMFSVKSTGQVGIGNIAGNTWPSESVFIVGPHDSGSEGGQIQFYNSNGAGTAWFLDVWNNDFRFLTGNNISGSSGNAMILTNAGNLTTSGSIRSNAGKYYFESGCDNYLALQSDGNAVIYNSGGGFMGWASGTSCSDIRLKENIRPLENVLQNLGNLRTIRYTYKPETGLTQAPQIGVVAQELADKYPEMVYYNKELDQYLVYYDKLTVLLLKGMQEQQDLIGDLMLRVNELESRP